MPKFSRPIVFWTSLALCPSIYAQDQQKAEKITVTGSRIKRTDVETSTSILVIDREKIEASGFTNVADVLRETAASTHGAVKERSGRGSSSSAGANIRGLGEEYTLVLVNGRRLANDAILESPDISLIPLVAIEQIEIIKEGASAIYGSDAIGGVVNIITRKDFNGTSFLYSRGFTEQKGGEEERFEAITGVSSNRGNTTFSVSWRSKNIVMNQDRDFSAEGWSITGNPGSYRTIPVRQAGDAWEVDPDRDKGKWTMDPTCPDDELHRPKDNGDGNTFCQFNFAKTMSSVPKSDTLIATVDGDYQLFGDTRMFLNLRHGRRSTFWNYAPAPQTFMVTDPAVAQTMGVDLEDNTGLQLRYRTVELGTRDNQIETNNTSGTMGLKGEIGLDWEWEISAAKTRIHSLDQGVNGYWLVSRMNELIASGEYNPLDPNRDTSKTATTRYQTTEVTISQLDQYEAIVTGEWLELPGGPIGVAIGAHWMDDYYFAGNDTLTVLGEVAGSSATNGEGHRTIKSYFMELALPLTETIDANLAARHDNYSDIGDATSPQLGVKWQPSPSFILRTSMGQGFKAPTLQALNNAGGYGYPSFIDVPYCNQGVEAACSRAQYEVETLKAENLKPEKSSFATVGTVFAPSRHFDFALDFWYTKIEDRIAGGTDRNLQALMAAEAKGADYASKGIVINRASDGSLETVVLPNINMATTEISGFDFGLNAQTKLDQTKLQFNSEISYFLAYKEALFSGMDAIDTVGTYGRPQWKLTSTVAANIARSHGVSLTNRMIASQEKAQASAGRLPSHSEFDTQYTLNGSWDGSISIGATNVFDKRPPIDRTANPTVDSDLYNTTGRNYYLKVTQNF